MTTEPDPLSTIWRPPGDTDALRPRTNGDGHADQEPAVEGWQEFPLDALPPLVAGFAEAVARTMCVDPAMAVLPMLTVAGACIGNAARARMSADYHAPANVWSAIVSRSGERKSPVLRAVMRPIHETQAQRATEHAEAVAAYEGEMERWRALPRKERGDRPMEPGPFPHLYLSECTTEAIAARLSQQPRGLPVIMEELSSLFRGMDQYRAKGGHDRESYLAFYDAGPAKIDRKSAIPAVIFIPRAFVAVTGMIQPGALAGVLGPAEFDSGLAARFLFAAPPPRPAGWTVDSIPDSVRDGWRDLLHTLLAHPLREEPVLIPPSDDAMVRWARTHDRMDAARHVEPDDRMRAALAKLIGAVPRLALICQMVSAASGEHGAAVRVIDDTSMGRAVRIVEWCATETRRVYGVLEDGGRDDDVLAWIARRGGQVKPRELCHRWRMFRAKGAAESYLTSLVEEGIGRWQWHTPPVGRPSQVFVLLEHPE